MTAFLRNAGSITPEEGLAFNYWLVILSLLKVGIPYDAILSFTEQEISLVIGTQGALVQREADEEARQERLAAQRNRVHM